MPKRFLPLLIFIILLVGCTGSPDGLWLKNPGWSRAKLVGTTMVGDPTPLVTRDDGRMYLLFIDQSEGRYFPRVRAYDSDMQILWDRAYEEVAIARPDRPHLQWHDGDLDLFWISNEQLYQATVEPNTGLMRTWPQLLSADHRVASYAVAQAPSGELHIWFAGPRRQPGLYTLPQGNGTEPPVLVDEMGVRPSLIVDPAGNLHAVWAHYPQGRPDVRIYYALYQGGIYQPKQPAQVAAPRVGATSVFHGPVFGMDTSMAYVFWTVEIRTGTSAGEVTSEYVTFTPAETESVSASRPTILRVPNAYDLPAAGVEGSYQVGPRTPIESPEFSSSSRVTDIYTDKSIRDELAVGVRALLPYLMRKSETQVATVYFQGGIPQTYQLLSFTAGDSTSPFVIGDEAGHLYQSWHERGDGAGFLVYVAGTSAQMITANARLSSDDISRLTVEVLFGLLSGALLLPFALMWFIVPLAIIALTSFIRGEDEDLRNWRTLLSLGLAIWGYWVSKLGLMPGMRDYVPLSAWIPTIPAWLQPVLQVGVPAVIMVLALWVAWFLTYRRRRHAPVLFILIYITIDAVLTTAIYGVIFLAAT